LVETNRYYHKYLDTGWRMVPIAWYDCSENGLFLAIIVQMVHYQRDMLKECGRH